MAESVVLLCVCVGVRACMRVWVCGRGRLRLDLPALVLLFAPEIYDMKIQTSFDMKLPEVENKREQKV